MIKNAKEIIRHTMPTSEDNYVRIGIGNRGTISFSVGCVQRYLLGVNYVRIFVDKENRLIYFVPTDDNKRGYKLFKTNTSSYSNSRGCSGSAVIKEVSNIKRWAYEAILYVDEDTKGFVIKYEVD